MPTNASKAHAYNPTADSRFTDGMRAQVSGDLEAARRAYESILADAPDSADVHHALGTVYLQQQSPECLNHFTRAHELEPENPRFALHLAQVQTQAGQPEQAAATLAPAARAHPENGKVFTEFFNACVAAKQFEPAAELLRTALARNPDDITFHSLLLYVYEQLGDAASALPHMDFLYKHQPRQADPFFVKYVKALRNTRQLERADQILEEGLKLHPMAQDLLSLQAGSLHLQGKLEESLLGYQRALLMNTSNDTIRAAIGIVKMLMTDLKDGWQDYSYRPNIDATQQRLEGYYPKWSGQELEGRKLLLWTEQGIGDVIMFLSLLPWLLEKKPQVTCIVMEKLLPLMRRSFPQVDFTSNVNVSRYDASGQPAYDYHLPVGELMGLALPHYQPSDHAPFLKADAAYSAAMRARYLKEGEARGIQKLVGISWHTKSDETAYMRNIPLNEWDALFSLPHVQYFVMQYGDHQAEIDAVNARFPGKLVQDPLINPLTDIDALAAQMMAMDEVVSIQNATVHLAGAIGAKVTLMLNFSSDWRWGLGSHNHWYKSVTIERQEKLLDWQPVLKRVAARL